MYLYETSSSSCMSLITPLDTSNDGFAILGAPFFRNTTVQFDYETDHITIWSKNGNSPITAQSDSTSSSSLGAGAISRIVIGGLVFLLLIAGGVYMCMSSKKGSEAKMSHSIQDDEDAGLVGEDAPTA